MKVVVFGATGMIGQGVLCECLNDDRIDSVITVGRRKTATEAMGKAMIKIAFSGYAKRVLGPKDINAAAVSP
jgi:uncharacterized protein YbjT (DUF2867 family)